MKTTGDVGRVGIVSADESAARARALTRAATMVFGNERLAEKWLSTPKMRFGGKTPLEMLAINDGVQQVEELLLQIYFGNLG